MKKVSTMGEIVIDFMPVDIHNPITYEQKPGGAPANVAATVAKLGGDATFYSQVGADDFGDFLIESLNEMGVNTKYILRTEEAKTGVVFVSLDKEGNRSFNFYRNPSADMLYSKQNYLEHSSKEDIFAFSSVSLIDMPIKDAHHAIIDITRKNGGVIVFDTNLRLGIWKDHVLYRKVVKNFIALADIVKISEEELAWITQVDDPAQGILMIKHLGPKLILFTKGKEGSTIYMEDKLIDVPGYNVKTVDTTGAGDAFLGAFLYQLSIHDKHYDELSVEELGEIQKFCNAVAALSTTAKGAMAAIPTPKQVKDFLK